MENFGFALPQISDMPKDEQGALLVNQAVAAIISAYLSHASAVYTADQTAGSGGNSTFAFTQSELIGLINDVQNALKSF